MLQVVLVGQLKLQDILRRPNMEYLKQRIVLGYRLDPLNLNQTEEYIQYRIKVVRGDPTLFDSKACRLIYYYSKGIPRLINFIAEAALWYGYEKQKKVIDDGLINKVISEGTIAMTRQAGNLRQMESQDIISNTEIKFAPPATPIIDTQAKLAVSKDGAKSDNGEGQGLENGQKQVACRELEEFTSTVREKERNLDEVLDTLVELIDRKNLNGNKRIIPREKSNAVNHSSSTCSVETCKTLVEKAIEISRTR